MGLGVGVRFGLGLEGSVRVRVRDGGVGRADLLHAALEQGLLAELEVVPG